MLYVFSAAMSAIILTAGATGGWAKDQIPFEVAKMIFEFNFTDNDLGVQVSLNGDPWKEVKIVGPDRSKIFEVKIGGSLKRFGFTELFSESNEPELDEVPFKDILALFPEGEYKFFGKTVEGEKLVGTAMLTHAIPDGPSMLLAQVMNGDLVISWVAPPAVSSLTGLPIDIVAYQVIVERADNDQLGAAPRIFDIKLPATETSVTVPPQFLESREEYEFEVLAIEIGGNQTISSSSF
ncbi:MAG TPA: fibronectin type III domain-containing protein, partial [Candidatus Binatia bacterium]|nr:fibronectin type III domain-containing protein [Candidatus Binatia bacterium]